jgi:hypothetical protein
MMAICREDVLCVWARPSPRRMTEKVERLKPNRIVAMMGWLGVVELQRDSELV